MCDFILDVFIIDIKCENLGGKEKAFYERVCSNFWKVLYMRVHILCVFLCVFFSGIGRGVFGQVWCGETQCHREGGLWHSQTEERADGGLQAQSLPATWATWPPWHGPGKTYYRVIHPSISLSLQLWTFLTYSHPYIFF